MSNVNEDVNFKVKSLVNDVRKCVNAVLQEVGVGRDASFYKACLKIEFAANDIAYIESSNLPYFYKGTRIDFTRFESVLIIKGILMVKLMERFDSGLTPEYSGLTPEYVASVQKDMACCSLNHGVVVNFFAPNKNDAVSEIKA